MAAISAADLMPWLYWAPKTTLTGGAEEEARGSCWSHYRAAKYLGHGVSIGDTRWSGGEQHIAVIGTLGPVTGAKHS